MSRQGKTLAMGQHELVLPSSYLGEMRDATHLMNNPVGLRDRLAEDGYLLLRGLQSRERVLRARRMVVNSLAGNSQLESGTDPMDAVACAGGRGAFLGGMRKVSRNPDLLQLLESPEITGFFERLLGQSVRTFDFKWLRAVGPGENTGAHFDVVYMGRGTVDQLFTVWTPLGSVRYDDGPLAVVGGSHRAETYRRVRETYGRIDVDRDNIGGGGWFSRDPIEIVDRFGLPWLTTEFQPGDVVIFGMFLLHASLNNRGRSYRISCDTRFQSADAPVDERWVGQEPQAHSVKTASGPAISIEQARAQWGV